MQGSFPKRSVRGMAQQKKVTVPYFDYPWKKVTVPYFFPIY